MKTKVVVITGPTASGKTELALKLADKFHGEIISADSRQVYRSMDVGTGKVKRKHHLIDVASPKRTFTVAQYKKLAQEVIKQLKEKQKLPIIVGGTGFYIEALIYDLPIPEVKPNPVLRKKLEKLSAEQLFKKLKKKDPRRARTIERKNKRRLIRALEIIEALGKVPPHPPLAPSPPWEEREGVRRQYNFFILGIKLPNDELRTRINKRIDKRVSGIIKEIKTLRRAQGLSWQRLIGFGLEYKYFSLYLQGKLSKQEAIAQLKTATWHFAKRQYNYFKRLPVKWIKNQKQAEQRITKFLEG